MRALAVLALVALLAIPIAAADHGRWETRRYQSLWPVEEMGFLLEAMADGRLVCEPAPGVSQLGVRERSLGGVCFDIHAGDTSVALFGSSTLLVFTPPTFILRFTGADGTLISSTATCARGHTHAIPEGTTRLMALAIDGTVPGCREGPSVWGTLAARIP